MTVMTATDADYDDDTDPPGVCWRCGGPCLLFKGSVHGWTCTTCLDKYLDASAAKAQERERVRQAKKARAAWDYSTSVTAEDRRRDAGGQCYVPRPGPASIP
jgi:hypothetical protein